MRSPSTANWRGDPRVPTRERPGCGNEDPAQPKLNTINNNVNSENPLYFLFYLLGKIKSHDRSWWLTAAA